MAKGKEKKTIETDGIPRWELRVDYVETCNCNFGCPCNFSGYPTDGHCEALVGYHVRQGHWGRTKLDGLDVIYAAAWPLVMKLLGPGALSFDHAGKNAFYARLEFAGPQSRPMTLRARDVMQPDVLSVSPDMTLAALEDFLLSNRISGAPVVEDGALI